MLLFVAARLDDPRKGGDMVPAILDAVAKGSNRRVIGVCIGNRTARFSDPRFIQVGPVQDERLLNFFYNAADLVIHPSREDNLPNVLLESVAAGRPVGRYDVGGCGDIVKSWISGLLVKAGDVNGFVEGVRCLLNLSPSEQDQLRKSCRNLGETQFPLERQAQAYAALFESLVVQGARSVI